MTDDWFSEFVYQIVADRKYISKELTDVFDHGKATVLPPWVRLRALSFELWRAFSDLTLTASCFCRTRWAPSPEARFLTIHIMCPRCECVPYVRRVTFLSRLAFRAQVNVRPRSLYVSRLQFRVYTHRPRLRMRTCAPGYCHCVHGARHTHGPPAGRTPERCGRRDVSTRAIQRVSDPKPGAELEQ
jgi:hypothetical protein